MPKKPAPLKRVRLRDNSKIFQNFCRGDQHLKVDYIYAREELRAKLAKQRREKMGVPAVETPPLEKKSLHKIWKETKDVKEGPLEQGINSE